MYLLKHAIRASIAFLNRCGRAHRIFINWYNERRLELNKQLDNWGQSLSNVLFFCKTREISFQNRKISHAVIFIVVAQHVP